MGGITVTGAILIITGWFALVEYDHFTESERKQILHKIKRSPAYISLIALMPVGMLINLLGAYMGSQWTVLVGASLILLQGIIFSLLFWRRKRWKSIMLLSVIVVLGILMYLPLFMR